MAERKMLRTQPAIGGEFCYAEFFLVILQGKYTDEIIKTLPKMWADLIIKEERKEACNYH